MLFFYIFLISPALDLYLKYKKLSVSLRPIRVALSSYDLDTLAFEMEYLRPQIVGVRDDASKLNLFSPLPVVGPYVRDLYRGSLAVLKAYDLSSNLVNKVKAAVPTLRYNPGPSETSASETRLAQATTALKQISVNLPEYKKELEDINREISSIDERRYPQTFKGISVRQTIKTLKSAARISFNSFDDLIKLLANLPELSGLDQDKSYLIIIQDNNEPRPGGGLLGGYAFFAVHDGSFSVMKSGDIYFLDETVDGPRPVIPEFLRRYYGYSTYMREANYSVDFKATAGVIRELWQSTPGSFPLEGIMVVDTDFVKALIDLLGPVTLSPEQTVNSQNADEVMRDFFFPRRRPLFVVAPLQRYRQRFIE
ncbi:MAG: DUF4012 domain-containing protein [Patescibacteria group bacterium]|nr:DUF4012 domain-containing protein [Patescibacteria group bacterium]